MTQDEPAAPSPVTIASRFRGPDQSGNGGYSCGVVARGIDGSFEVTLKKPPPLDRPLALVASGSARMLLDGDEEIASGRPGTVDVDVPPMPAPADVESAEKLYCSTVRHPVPSCFVCGPNRGPSDGLRIFAGPHTAGTIAAAHWIPDSNLADDDGNIRPEFVWAALDCPGYFGLQRPDIFALLGRMTSHITQLPACGQRHTVIGWPLGSEGRKHYAGTAIFDETGRVLAKASAIWIELPGERFKAY